MHLSDDIANLFKRFGGSAQDYLEVEPSYDYAEEAATQLIETLNALQPVAPVEPLSQAAASAPIDIPDVPSPAVSAPPVSVAPLPAAVNATAVAPLAAAVGVTSLSRLLAEIEQQREVSAVNAPAQAGERTVLKAKVIAMVSAKGGVGKSTLAAALASTLKRDGGRTLALDFDPQNALCLHLGGNDQWPGIAQDHSQESALRADPTWLARHLAGLELGERDTVIIDTPCGATAYLAQALAIADVAVVVTLADGASYSSLEQMDRLLAPYRQGERPLSCKYVINQLDTSRQFSLDVCEVLKRKIGNSLLGVVRQDHFLGEALAYERWPMSVIRWRIPRVLEAARTFSTWQARCANCSCKVRKSLICHDHRSQFHVPRPGALRVAPQFLAGTHQTVAERIAPHTGSGGCDHRLPVAGLHRQRAAVPILALIVLSLVASLRYLYWRLTDTLGFEGWLDMLFGYGLVLAEIYALVVLVFGYVQTAWPLRRRPVLLSGNPNDWPTVDVFIPTYNEALNIVKLSIFAAQAMDWPKDKLRVHVLDDGRRDEFRLFCNRIGVNYITRDNNFHAKAGNLNEALKVTDGEYIAMFDADHVPTRSFLQIGMGWFLKDSKLAMLQTPHFFFSPDPFEKNLNTFRAVPNEGELFYGLVQDGNDLWNATFFCGSCAILRRKPLEEIGRASCRERV